MINKWTIKLGTKSVLENIVKFNYSYTHEKIQYLK
jgi:hypothetical protein